MQLIIPKYSIGNKVYIFSIGLIIEVIVTAIHVKYIQRKNDPKLIFESVKYDLTLEYSPTYDYAQVPEHLMWANYADIPRFYKTTNKETRIKLHDAI